MRVAALYSALRQDRQSNLRVLASARPDGQSSLSASSPNASGTEQESSSATDPYPTASHPKRSWIASIARSAIQHAKRSLCCQRMIA